MSGAMRDGAMQDGAGTAEAARMEAARAEAMRVDAMRARAIPALAHRTAVQMRFADTDALGHVNNGSFVVYVENGRLAFLRDAGTEVRSLILAHLAVDFRRQVTFGQALDVATWVERVGATSVTMRQAVLADGVVAAEVRSVVVSFDYATQRATPWSAESRRALESYVAT